jgi:glycosyltransferase 2 family protein
VEKIKTIFKNKKVKFFIKASVSIGFLVYVIFKVNWNDVWYGIKKIEWWQAGIYIIVLIAGMAISSYKWKLLASHKNFQLKYFDYFKYYLVGTFINNFMPSFIGGDTYRAYQVGKQDRRFVESASAVMIDRITGLIGAMILAIFFSILNATDVLNSDILIIANTIIIVALFIDVIIVIVKKTEFWGKITNKLIPKRFFYLIKELYSYGNDNKIIRKSIFLSVCFNIVGVALTNYILFWSLGIHINILDYLSVIFLAGIISSVPLSINNIGIKEWSYITLFGALGVPAAPVITVSILSRILQMLVSFIAIPIYLKNKADNIIVSSGMIKTE